MSMRRQGRPGKGNAAYERYGGMGRGRRGAPGKKTLVQRVYGPPRASPVPHKAGEPSTDAGEDASSVASEGLRGSAQALPHLEAIQKSFGDHDVTGIKAHVGGPAVEAADALDAEAYATGDCVAFRGPPDLHTAAHEAAHVVQQRAGVQLKGGLGDPDDAYEQQADQVADLVVDGKSAESELSGAASAAPRTNHDHVQRKAVEGGDSDAPSPSLQPDVCTVDHTTDAKVLRERANQFLAIMQAAHTDCDTHGEAWQEAATEFGLCYFNAYERHEAVVKKQDELDGLKRYDLRLTPLAR